MKINASGIAMQVVLGLSQMGSQNASHFVIPSTNPTEKVNVLLLQDSPKRDHSEQSEE